MSVHTQYMLWLIKRSQHITYWSHGEITIIQIQNNTETNVLVVDGNASKLSVVAKEQGYVLKHFTHLHPQCRSLQSTEFYSVVIICYIVCSLTTQKFTLHVSIHPFTPIQTLRAVTTLQSASCSSTIHTCACTRWWCSTVGVNWSSVSCWRTLWKVSSRGWGLNHLPITGWLLYTLRQPPIMFTCGYFNLKISLLNLFQFI